MVRVRIYFQSPPGKGDGFFFSFFPPKKLKICQFGFWTPCFNRREFDYEVNPALAPLAELEKSFSEKPSHLLSVPSRPKWSKLKGRCGIERALNWDQGEPSEFQRNSASWGVEVDCVWYYQKGIRCQVPESNWGTRKWNYRIFGVPAFTGRKFQSVYECFPSNLVSPIIGH